MIRHIRYKDIDTKKWDACIDGASNGIIFAYSWYLDSVCDQWDALVEGDYEYVFPLPWKKKWGIRYVFQPFFMNQLGLFSVHSPANAKTDEFLRHIPGEFLYTELGLRQAPGTSNAAFRIEERKSQFVSLQPGIDAIRLAYSDNLKRNLKKAMAFRLSVKPVEASEVIRIFRSSRGNRPGVFHNDDYKNLFNLINTLSSHSKGESLGVYDPGGALHAAAHFMQSHDRIIYLKGAASEKGRESGAMSMLMDHYISLHAGTGKNFDFGGSMAESVARFNKGFGAKDYVYLHLSKNNLPHIIRWLK